MRILKQRNGIIVPLLKVKTIRGIGLTYIPIYSLLYLPELNIEINETHKYLKF